MAIADYIRQTRLVTDTFPSAVFAKDDGEEIIYKVRIVAPNIKKEDVEVVQEGDYLVVTGEVRQNPDEKVVVTSGNYPASGSFKKVFNVKGGEVTAVILKNGVLEITIKDTSIKRKKIEVQVDEPELLVEAEPKAEAKSRTRGRSGKS